MGLLERRKAPRAMPIPPRGVGGLNGWLSHTHTNNPNVR